MTGVYQTGKHVFYWMGSTIFLILFIGHKTDSSFTIPFVITLLPVTVGLPYIFTRFIIPEFLLKKRYVPFGIYGITAIMGSLYIEMMVILLAFIFFADFTFEVMRPIAGNLVLIAAPILFVQCLFVIIHFVKKMLHPKQEVLQNPFLKVRSERKMMNVKLDQIHFIESLGDYVKIHLLNEFVITKEKISSLEKRLPDFFLRVHRSYLINIKKITSFTKTGIEIKGETLPISRTYKKEALDILSKND